MSTYQWSFVLMTGLVLAGCVSRPNDLITEASQPPPPASVTIQPPTASPTPPLLQAVDPTLVEDGHDIYIRNCSSCHGTQGEGYANELGAPAMDASEHASMHPDQQIREWIMNGKLGFERQMPGFGDALDDREIHAVIAYLHTLWTSEQLETQQDLSARWPATPEPTWTPLPIMRDDPVKPTPSQL